MSEKTELAAAWLYEGLWAVLVRWFRVPAAPPSLPAREGETIEKARPSPDFIRYLKLWFWLGLTFMDGLFFAGWIASFFVNIWLGVLLAPVFVAVAILPDIAAYAGIHLRYDTTWYIFSDRSMRIRRGIWTIHETTITFENIQNVKVEQGPVQRFYGIANVIVQTAGGGGQSHQKGGAASQSHAGLIEGVADAERIRDMIMARVRKSRSAGLGDEDIRPERLQSAWTREHIAALREIRDALSKLGE